MINGNVSSQFISLWFASVHGAASSIQNCARLWFCAYKNYKNGNSARHTALQCHIRPSITQNRSDNFSSGISRKLPKIATSNVIFLRTADRIAANFCMTIKKTKPNDTLQNCVHSCSTLNLLCGLIKGRLNYHISHMLDWVLDWFRTEHVQSSCWLTQK